MDENKPLEILWKVSQVARYFGVHIVTVHRWIRSGKIDPAKVVRFSQYYHIPRSEVERLAALNFSKEDLMKEDLMNK